MFNYLKELVFANFYRRQVTKSDDKRDSGLKTPEGVERFDNIKYGKSKKWEKLDVYLPKEKKDKTALPLIISVHGGGFIYGDKERYQYYCMSLALRGFAVINFTYKLAPEGKFPKQLEDSIDVIRWATEHASEYGLDMKNTFFVGDSAGANLVLSLCALLKDSNYASKIGLKFPEGFDMKAVGLNCGIYDLKKSLSEPVSTEAEKNMHKASMMVWECYLGKNLKDKIDLASPFFFVNEKFPPAYICTAQGDFLKNDGIELDKLYTQKGIPHEFKIYGSKEHPLYHVFFCNMNEKEGQTAIDEEMTYFKTFVD
jgi:acetyl esterase/lipase